MWKIDYTSTYLNALMQLPILMEQLEGYEVRPSKVYRADISEGRQVWGSNGSGSNKNSGSGGDEDSKKSLVSLLDKVIYETMDEANKMLDNNMKRLGYK